MAKKILIDVSEHKGKIDWEKVKPQIDGAILRCGYGMDIQRQDDAQFKRNADECTRLGIPFGVYLYSYADSIEKAKSEAAHVLRLIKPYKLSFPVYYDLEEPGTQKGAVERANVFGDIIEGAGYQCGVYANLNWWNNYLKGLERFTKWVAQYNTKCDYKGTNLDIWQYTDSGKVDGIKGNVDMNECYRDFQAPAKPKKKTVDELAKEVMLGKWGNGTERVNRLTKEYGSSTAKAVQDRVNELLAPKKKTIDQIAKEVIDGKYGNGLARKRKLTKEYGTDTAEAVQKRVNEIYKKRGK